MRSLITSLVVASMLFLASFTPPASAWDWMSRPNAYNIEILLRDLLAEDGGGPWSLQPYRDSELIDLDLIVLERLSSNRWHAEVELIFDFGPPPPGVLGFESIRVGRYHLRLSRDGGRLGLLRFNPVGRVHPLPVSR